MAAWSAGPPIWLDFRSVMAGSGSEVDLAQLLHGVDGVAPRSHQEPLRASGLLGRGLRDHPGEVERRADLLVVVPPGDVQYGNVELVEAGLVADVVVRLVEC